MHWKLQFFGVFDVPALPVGAPAKHTLEEIHGVLFNVLLVLASLHIPAAVKHHLVDRDSVLKSMVPRRS